LEACWDFDQDMTQVCAFVARLLEDASSGLIFVKLDPAELWLESASVCNALASCTKLETLILRHYENDRDGLSHATVELFGKLRAPLRSLTLGSLDWFSFPIHVYDLLDHLARTLEELNLGYVSIDPWNEHERAPTFPHVHTLRLEGAEVNASTLIPAFPSLVTLQIETCETGAETPPSYAESTPFPSELWSRLDVFQGDIESLWMTGSYVQKAVLLNVSRSLRYTYPHHVTKLVDVLRRVQPEMLRICTQPEDSDGRMVYDLSTLIQCAPDVEVLEIDVASYGMSVQNIQATSILVVRV
jgi:hypothetical protein